MTSSASEARQRLFRLIEVVNNDHTVRRISSRAGSAVPMSAEGYDAWQKTAHRADR
ncbi:type II toxin-antitoxin system Phd/YefM family antitoxin [Streptomyces sp. NPDC005775]|uniref:type II toxin-antitoxin system Phd/YefM family antitoxin n=1 Tax=unclassified Streptomyces TaxID=2593676 RepID=UPI0033FE7D6C